LNDYLPRYRIYLCASVSAPCTAAVRTPPPAEIFDFASDFTVYEDFSFRVTIVISTLDDFAASFIGSERTFSALTFSSYMRAFMPVALATNKALRFILDSHSHSRAALICTPYLISQAIAAKY